MIRHENAFFRIRENVTMFKDTQKVSFEQMCGKYNVYTCLYV